LAEAIAAYRKAIELKPDFALAYTNVGVVLMIQRQLDEAAAACRKAIELNPDLADPQIIIGIASMLQGQYKDALIALKTAEKLLPEDAPSRPQVQDLVQQCERSLALETRLLGAIEGKIKPANAAEQMEFAQLCIGKKLYAGAARFRRDAFAADPKLAENVTSGARYDAAFFAILAACGQGKDSDKLDDKVCARWRQQALDWLRADLAWWSKSLDAKSPSVAAVQQTMRHWQTDADLAGVRDENALAKLPDDERARWRQLWTDVSALIKRTEDGK